MAISNERIRLAEYLAREQPAAVANFIAKTPKIQSALLDFYGPELDIEALVSGLQSDSELKVDRIRDFIDDFLEVKAGKLPVGNLPMKVRTRAARDEFRENSQLAAQSFLAATKALGKGRVLSSAFHATKFMTEASAATLSALNFTKRERKFGMALGLEMALVTAFAPNVIAAVNPDDVDAGLKNFNQSNLSERLDIMPRAPLEVTIKPQAQPDGMRGDFNGATTLKDSHYLLSPYLIKKVNEEPQARQYMEMIIAEAKKNDLDPVLFANQLFRETIHFNPSYIYGPDASPAGALGFGQITPGTGKSYGLITQEDFFNPQKSIAAAARIMHDLTAEYKGDQVLAMAAYNGGRGAVNYVKEQLGRNDISAQDWMAFMTKRYETLGDTSGSAWHMETRLYIGDITNQNWPKDYLNWAKKMQGLNAMSYVAGMDKDRMPRTPATMSIESIILN